MSFPATYSGWGHLGQGTMTRTASAAAAAYPSWLPQQPVSTRTPPTVTKTAATTPVVPTVPAALVAVEDPAYVPEVVTATAAPQPSGFMRVLPWGIGLLVIGGGLALARRK